MYFPHIHAKFNQNKNPYEVEGSIGAWKVNQSAIHFLATGSISDCAKREIIFFVLQAKGIDKPSPITMSSIISDSPD
jgi:hypothetical protein